MQPLTARETQVARLVTRGLTYKDVGGALGISVQTVQAHVVSSAAKIGGEIGSPKLRLILFILNLEEPPAP